MNWLSKDFYEFKRNNNYLILILLFATYSYYFKMGCLNSTGEGTLVDRDPSSSQKSYRTKQDVKHKKAKHQ
jgi:hypothetical protein